RTLEQRASREHPVDGIGGPLRKTSSVSRTKSHSRRSSDRELPSWAFGPALKYYVVLRNRANRPSAGERAGERLVRAAPSQIRLSLPSTDRVLVTKPLA